jgi:hypothetical protein
MTVQSYTSDYTIILGLMNISLSALATSGQDYIADLRAEITADISVVPLPTGNVVVDQYQCRVGFISALSIKNTSAYNQAGDGYKLGSYCLSSEELKHGFAYLNYLDQLIGNFLMFSSDDKLGDSAGSLAGAYTLSSYIPSQVCDKIFFRLDGTTAEVSSISIVYQVFRFTVDGSTIDDAWISIGGSYF